MLYLDRQHPRPLYEQIYAYYKEAILQAQLTPANKLPPTRQLAAELGIGRNTVDKAYQQLAAEGYITARPGSGFIVNRMVPLLPPVAVCPSSAPPPSQAAPLRCDFTYSAVDNRIFPHKTWRKSMLNALTWIENQPHIHYPARHGEAVLREQLARYLEQSRGVRCQPEQIIITCGHQHSMEIIARLFSRSGKRLALENPGYIGARLVFQNHAYTLLPIPVESDGIATSKLTDLRADLLYLTPSHQFPTGAVLPIGKRQALLHWARQNDAYLIEDDYNSELRYDTNPIPSLQSLDSAGRTIYSGTLSKSLSPTLRVAYLVLPPALLPVYQSYYHRYNAQVAQHTQLALADFMAEGHYERHLNRLRTFYRKRQKQLLTTLQDIFGDRIHISGQGAGLHLLLTIVSPLTTAELTARAAAIGIALYPASLHYLAAEDCPHHQFLFGFAILPENKYPAILGELAAAWDMAPPVKLQGGTMHDETK